MQTAQPKLQVWMRFGQPLEPVIQDVVRVFDAWETMGVNGIVLGRMYFRDEEHKYHAIFEPDKRLYQRFGLPAPDPPARTFPERRRQLDRLLAEAKRRKWSILIFAPNAGALTAAGRHGNFVNSDAWQVRILDTLSHFPEADGCIIDGPEWGYEIEPGQGRDLFADLPEAVRPLAEASHYDFDQLRRASSWLFDQLHAVEQFGADGGPGPGLLNGTPGGHAELDAWFQFRTAVLTGTVKTLKGLMREQRPDLLLGMGPRSAVFAPLCGYDFRGLMEHLDYLLPKHYFWQRGYDGFYGTVYRWMKTLSGWNPGVSDEQALQVVQRLFNIELPGLKHAFDFERGLPDEFFTKVVTRETRAALAAVQRPEQVVPWVDVGRRPHEGDPLDAHDLIRILEASREAGLHRFLYHNHSHLSEAEVEVLRNLCGQPDRPLPTNYRPPDELHEHVG